MKIFETFPRPRLVTLLPSLVKKIPRGLNIKTKNQNSPPPSENPPSCLWCTNIYPSCPLQYLPFFSPLSHLFQPCNIIFLSLVPLPSFFFLISLPCPLPPGGGGKIFQHIFNRWVYPRTDLCVFLSSTMQPKLRDCCLVASVPIMVAMPWGREKWNSSISYGSCEGTDVQMHATNNTGNFVAKYCYNMFGRVP
jgi:hypothetical protein